MKQKLNGVIGIAAQNIVINTQRFSKKTAFGSMPPLESKQLITLGMVRLTFDL